MMNRYNFTYIIPMLLMFFSCSENISGCLDINACNYNVNANQDDGSCQYPQESSDCDGNCLIEVDCNGDCGGTAVEDECGVCGGDGPKESSDWDVQIIASMNPWIILDPIFDENNFFGVSSSSQDENDSMDTPEPPPAPDNWISGYFYHPEWDLIFGDKFTQDYKSNEFCGSKEWEFNVEANSSGPLELLFLFNNVPDSLELELTHDENISLSDSLILNFFLEENMTKEFSIKVSVN